MALGLLTGYGVAYGLGAKDPTPWLVKAAGMAGILGWGILYPLWTIWLGRLIPSGRLPWPRSP